MLCGSETELFVHVSPWKVKDLLTFYLLSPLMLDEVLPLESHYLDQFGETGQSVYVQYVIRRTMVSVAPYISKLIWAHYCISRL